MNEEGERIIGDTTPSSTRKWFWDSLHGNPHGGWHEQETWEDYVWSLLYIIRVHSWRSIPMYHPCTSLAKKEKKVMENGPMSAWGYKLMEKVVKTMGFNIKYCETK